MMIGKGRIAFAHVEQVIDFTSPEGVEAYVKWNEEHHRQVCYRRNQKGKPYPFWSTKFVYEECVVITGGRYTNGKRYTITVMFPYSEHHRKFMGISYS